MKEIDLEYGYFEGISFKEIDSNDKDKNDDSDYSSELNLKKNIELLNAYFESKKENENFSENEEDEDESDKQISIVGTNDEEESVILSAEKKSKKEQSKEKPKEKRRYIGARLIVIISCIVIISMGLLSFLVSYFVTKDTRVNAEINNFIINSRTSSDCENRINNVIRNVKMFFELTESDEFIQKNLQIESVKFFDLNESIFSIYVVEDNQWYTNKSFLAKNNISEDNIIDYINYETSFLNKVEVGKIEIQNASPYFNFPAISIFFKNQFSSASKTIVILFSIEKFAEVFSTGKINESILLNNNGIVLIHPDYDIMLGASDMSQNEFVKEFIEKNQNGFQKSYIDSKGVEYIAACNKITDANCIVLTQVKSKTILAAINATTRRNIALMIAVLSIAILIIWIYAKSLSIPLLKLTEVSEHINKGNFDAEIFKNLNVNRTDEIGILNRSIKNEQDILNAVTSLTNKGVTKAIVTKEIDFEPHLKDITIFFSDIRGFTEISDGFNKYYGEKSAAEIVSFLNDYMSRMVNCITITGGVVDKFEGDAIMATWGVLRDDDLSYELLPDTSFEKRYLKKNHMNNVKQDSLNAIKATLAMRYALMEYNKAAIEFSKLHENDEIPKFKPNIKIGCGLNSGRVTVGFMGSKEKMEFTSIGDAVNLASRTESSNKPCGTDILITQDTLKLLLDYVRCDLNNYFISEENIKDEIIVEEIPVAFDVKGKGEQHFYGVVNMPNFDIEEFFKTTNPDFVLDNDCAKALGEKGPKNLSQVRKLLNIPEPVFNGLNLNETEDKIKTI